MKHPINYVPFLLRQKSAIGTAVIAICIAFNALVAQTVDPDTRLQQLQQFDQFYGTTQSTDAKEGEELKAETSSETDIGEQRILLKKALNHIFTVNFDNSLIYQSNAFLTNGNERSDAYWAGVLSGQYQYNINERSGITATVRQQLFRYVDHSVLDFNHGSVGARAYWVAPEEFANILFWGQYQLNSLTFARANGAGYSFGDEFLRYHSFSLGAQKSFFLNNYNALTLGAMGQFNYTDKSIQARNRDPQKDSYTLFLAHNYQYSRSLSTAMGYYLTNNQYNYLRTATNKKRDDWNHSLVASVSWKFNDWSKIVGNVSYVWNDSNERFYDYENGNIGASLELRYRF